MCIKKKTKNIFIMYIYIYTHSDILGILIYSIVFELCLIVFHIMHIEFSSIIHSTKPGVGMPQDFPVSVIAASLQQRLEVAEMSWDEDRTQCGAPKGFISWFITPSNYSIL